MQNRKNSLDVLRSIAIFGVIAQHFFLHTEFFSTQLAGFSMCIQSFCLSLFLSAVPLFIMLTGYLCSDKIIDIKYFKGGQRVAYSFLFFAIISVVFKIFYLNQHIGAKEIFIGITNLSIVRYSWYIDMWIGLFLITPFLNILYKGIESKKKKQLLIGVFIIITMLPGWLNHENLKLIPGYWADFYPVTYFFIGSYIREYKPVLKDKYGILAIVFFCSLNILLNSIIGNARVTNYFGSPAGIPGMIVSVVIFTNLYQRNVYNQILCNSYKMVSKLSLDMYLCCAIFDMILYPYFNHTYFINQPDFGKYFFIIVPAVFILSMFLAFIKNKIFKVLQLPT